MRKIFTALSLVAALIASGCTTMDMNKNPKQSFGTILGAIGGGLLGSEIGDGDGRLIAVGVGTLLGAAIGNEIGASLDRADKLYAMRTAQVAFEYNADGVQSSWRNPNTGHSGYTVPTRTYSTSSGPCREYQTTIMIDGRAETAYGTACRRPNGSWEIQ